MVDAALLRARVEVQGTQQASQQLNQLGRQIGTTGDRARDAQGRFTGLDRGVQQSGQAATRAATNWRGLLGPLERVSPVALTSVGAITGLGLAAGKSAQASIQWESSLAGVAKTLDTTGLSAAQAETEVSRIGSELRTMATQDIPIVVTELAGVAEAAGQLGIAREDVVDFTETMAMLGTTTDLTSEQSATAIARITNITSLAADEIDNFGAALVDLGNNSAATESEILNMTTRIAAAGSQAGLSEGELLGLAASLTSVGIRAEAGGTAVSQVMAEITKSVETADDRLSTFAEIAGMSAEQFAETWRTAPANAIASFIEGLAELEASGGSSVLVLDELGLAGVRQSQALRSAAGAGDLMRESMDRGNAAFEENNALVAEAGKRYETTASQIQLARNQIHDAAITLGDEFTPALAGALTGLAEFTTAAVDAFTEDQFTDVATQWQADLEELGTAASTFPDPPEEQGDKWLRFASDMAGIDWQDVWDGFFPDEDRFAEFEDTPLPEVTDEQIARLEEIISLYENTPSRVRTVTEAEFEHAQAMLEVIERHREFAALSEDQRDALDALVEGVISATASLTGSGESAQDAAVRLKLYDDNVRSMNRALEDGTEWNEQWHTSNENVVDVMIELADASRTATADGHRHNQMLRDSTGAYDEAAVAAGLLEQAIGNVSAINTSWRGVVDESKSAMQLWDGDIRENEAAIEALDEALAAGNITTEEHRDKVETLEWWNRRLQSGVDDMTLAWADNRVEAAEVTRQLEDLEQQHKDGKISTEEYESATADLRAEWERQNDPLVNLIEKIDDLITRLFDLDGTDAEATADVDDEPANAAIDSVETRLQMYEGQVATASVDADTSSAHAAIDALKAAITSGAILPVTIVASPTGGGIAGGGPFASGTGPGGVPHDMLALVGEEGPELAWLPQGTHILPNDETQRFLAMFGEGGLPGFQEGTGGPSQGVTGIDTAGFVDVGTMIGDAISVGVSLSLIESGQPTGSQFAKAIIDGATAQIDTDGDEVLDAWVVAHDRIPDLAASIGGDTVTVLLAEYAALQGELQLAMLSGDDTGEIQAQLDAIFALFAAWSGNAVEEVEAIWAAITDEQRASEAEALWDSILGSIQMPSAPISFDLEDLISGEAQQQLREDFQELWDLQRIFQEAGMTDQAQAIGEQMKALGLQEELIQGLLGTDFAQDLADEFASLDTAAAQQALWDQILDVPMEELASGGFAESLQETLDELLADLELAEALGLNTDALLAQIAEQEALLEAAGEAMATPIVEEFAAGMNEVLEISDAALADLIEIFEESPDIAEGMIDDVIQAVQDGRLPFEDAMSLLAQVPEDELIPALEALEEQLTVNLAEALLAFGEDSPEVQAILTSLGLIEDAANTANDALAIPNLNQKSGEVAQLSGGGGPVRVGGLGGGGLDVGDVAFFGTSFSPTAQGDRDLARILAPPDVRQKIAGTLGFIRGLIQTGAIDVDTSSNTEWIFSADSERGLTGLKSFMNRLRGSPEPIATMYVGNDGVREPQSGFALKGFPFTVDPFADGGIVTEPTLALLGDNPSGIEGVFPLERAPDFGFGGLGTQDMERLADLIGQAIVRHAGRNDPKLLIDGRQVAMSTLDHLSSGTPAGWSVGA